MNVPVPVPLPDLALPRSRSPFPVPAQQFDATPPDSTRDPCMMTELAHERLDAYKASIDFLAIADEVSGSLPKGRAYLADQLRRAATSIALNIAEGAGEFAAREKARFYRMARRSATECGAVLDVCARLGLGGAAQRLATGKALAHRIVSMLTVLVKRLGVLDSAGTGTGARERGEARSGRGTGTGTFTGGAGRVQRVSGSRL